MAPCDTDWVVLLSTTGPGHEAALAKLHGLLLKAVRHQVLQMYGRLPTIGVVRVDELINQAADEAMVAVLGKLSTFQGRSKFSTWAYKFGILYAAVEVRRSMWRHWDVDLASVPEQPGHGLVPEEEAEGAELSVAIREGLEKALTPHQRRVLIALLIDDVPIDVLADRLGTSRNALYKTLHDARGRLRRYLTQAGFLGEPTSRVIP
ncbi:RNA polymerase subunit sigma-24 [Arthrobacter sp. SW1]|uniref:RNA polymerase sigma factor n=1 Tax=Arthrobacter sp. SW1 TaxID=1920889 RepID=UPI000877B63F|nr:sigma-70 family RNA polymerase sigma factor [Arthrobacter sp. SW1]OFI37980.1 RNA polymerase subunit sigma-24 [Arthrobacter sp. SW1]